MTSLFTYCDKCGKRMDICQFKCQPSREEQYLKWLERMQSGAHELTEYECPECHQTIKTLIPEEGVYDSMCCCPFCEALYFKIVDVKGKVTIK